MKWLGRSEHARSEEQLLTPQKSSKRTGDGKPIDELPEDTNHWFLHSALDAHVWSKVI